jgi:phosphoserine aminotransferase
MALNRSEVHNLAAGPSPLPTSVLQQAAKGLLNYNGTGMGVCELSHRGKEFKGIIEKAEGKSWTLKFELTRWA